MDRYVLTVLVDMLPTPDPTDADTAPVEDFGRHVRALMTHHVDVVDYIARSLIDDTPLAATVFDRLAAMGQQRWTQYAEHGVARPGVDVTWAALNPLLLCLGAVMMRSHVDRHLPQPLASPTQMTRWQASVDGLIQFGNFRK